MTSRERLLAIIRGRPTDRVPLTAWCFGFTAPPHLRWRPAHWYSLRMEHIHTLPPEAGGWTLEDDFQRARTWLSLGIDDVLDVSVPWSVDPAVTWRDAVLPGPVLERRYATPAGPLRHAVRQTGERQGPGWVVQPDVVALFEDLNIPRAVEPVVSRPEHVAAVPYVYAPPDAAARRWFAQRLEQVRAFAEEAGVLVQAWSAFGMDAAVWLAGPPGAILLAMEEPEAFARLMEAITRTDRARTELAAATAGVDLLVQRGWYSSTDFWSPALFDRYVVPYVAELAAVAHQHGKPFAYVMTTGVATLGPRLAEAGVDLLYFVDPLQDRLTLEQARDGLADRLALAGGINALELQEPPARIRDRVHQALAVLGPTGRFILQPVDALFPDTPWPGVEAMIQAWQEWTCR